MLNNFRVGDVVVYIGNYLPIVCTVEGIDVIDGKTLASLRNCFKNAPDFERIWTIPITKTSVNKFNAASALQIAEVKMQQLTQ